MDAKGRKEMILSFYFAMLMVFMAMSLPAYGSGFAIYTQGASTLGEAAATIAHAEDPSAIFFNPALINQFEGTQMMLGTTFLMPNRKVKSDYSGKTYRTDNKVYFPSTFYATHKFSEQWSVGLGVFNPFGLSTDWPDDWEGRYIATKSELTTYDINPVISYQPIKWFSVAAGIDFLFLDSTLKKKIKLSGQTTQLPDVEQKFTGDGNGIGFNLGLLIKPHPDIALGISYRSEIEVDIDGKAKFGIPDEIWFVSPLFPDTTGNTNLKLPQQLQLGLFYSGFYPLSIEVGARWEGWSSFDNLVVKLDEPVAGQTESVTVRDWHDVWTENIGFRYQLNNSVVLMAGYLHQDNPVPDNTFDPSIPDAEAHLFSVGTDIRYKAFRISLAYAYQKFVDRDKENGIDDNPNDGVTNPATSANGTYSSDLHMVGVSLTYSF